MASQYDFISIGAGHNNLVAACYLAKAGRSVLLLERNDYPGGGVVTQELATPGFKLDVHSGAHIMIQASPLFQRDELGLFAQFGLEYIMADAPFGTAFDDGSAIITYRSIDKTVDSIAMHSRRDAEAYRRFAEMAVQTVPMFTAGMFSPPIPLGGMVAMMDQSPEGREILHMTLKSAWDIVNEWFESDKLKIHFMKFVSENLQGPEEKGTGIGLLVMIGLTHTTGIGLPKGGSGKLTDALLACLKHHGGEVRLATQVTGLVQERGRVTGVTTAAGETIKARQGVIGSIHPHLLRQHFPDIDAGVLARAERVELSPYSALNTHYTVHERIHFKGENDLLQEAFMTELVPCDMGVFRRYFDDLRYNRFPDPIPTFSGGTSTNLDPSRAPAGKAILYLMTFAPYNLNGQGPAAWAAHGERLADQMVRDAGRWIDNLSPDNIIGRCVHTPVDLESHSPSFQKGDFHGCAPYFYQLNGHRPTPDLANFTVPGVERFYLTGPFMHPGGGVFGGGRATAIKMFEDLGMDFERAASR